MRERNAFEKTILGSKRALQGGVYNYLGKQKTVNAPLKWKSSPEHPVAYLTYITKEEADILIKKNIYGSLKDGKPNRGPFGIASLQGSGGGSEGAGGDASGGGTSGGNDSTGGGNSGGEGTAGAAGAAGVGGNTTSQGAEDDSNNQSPGGPGQQSIGSPPGAPSFDSLDTVGMGPSQQSFGMSEQGFGIGPNDSIGPSMNSIDQQQEQEQEETPAPSYSMTRLSPIGIQAYNMSLANPTRTAADKALGFAMSPLGSIAATIADTSMRGVTAPNDYSQVANSVQNSISPSVDTGGGIASLSNTYKPLDNSNAYMPYTKKPFFTMDPLTGVFKSLI